MNPPGGQLPARATPLVTVTFYVCIHPTWMVELTCCEQTSRMRHFQGRRPARLEKLQPT
jgi:hypothetical protein